MRDWEDWGQNIETFTFVLTEFIRMSPLGSAVMFLARTLVRAIIPICEVPYATDENILGKKIVSKTLVNLGDWL